jgi:hypothetical protein
MHRTSLAFVGLLAGAMIVLQSSSHHAEGATAARRAKDPSTVTFRPVLLEFDKVPAAAAPVDAGAAGVSGGNDFGKADARGAAAAIRSAAGIR